MSAFIPIEFQKVFDKTKQFSIQITAQFTDNPAILGSRFGGMAYWEKEQQKPVDAKGKPLALLAQINFAELPQNTVFPRSGLLQYFIPRDDEYYGADLNASGQSGKLLTQLWENPHQTKAIDWQIVTDEDDLIPVFGAHQLSFSASQSVANIDTIECAEALKANPFEVLEDVTLNEAEASAFYEAINHFAAAEGHKLLGYPHWVGADPRESGDYRLLLQIDTDRAGDNDIMWGNEGVGYLFIKQADLLAGQFDKVWFFWDCYED